MSSISDFCPAHIDLSVRHPVVSTRRVDNDEFLFSSHHRIDVVVHNTVREHAQDMAQQLHLMLPVNPHH